MIGKLLRSEEANAAVALALSGTIVALVAKGDGPPSPARLLSGILSDPIPRREPPGVRVGDASLPAPHLRAAA